MLACKSNSTAADLATTISSQEPRYSYYRHSMSHVNTAEDGPQSDSAIVFIYTCPILSKIKERMVYASSRAYAFNFAAKETGMSIEKKVIFNSRLHVAFA